MTDHTGESMPVVRGRTNGIDHPMWEDGTPILVGQLVRYHAPADAYCRGGVWPAVVHEVSADEIRVGGMTSDDEEWEEQAGPDELERDPSGGSGTPSP